jgi:hypothetical protein
LCQKNSPEIALFIFTTLIIKAPTFFSISWGLYCKTYYGCNLRIFVISLSVFPCQAFPA